MERIRVRGGSLETEGCEREREREREGEERERKEKHRRRKCVKEGGEEAGLDEMRLFFFYTRRLKPARGRRERQSGAAAAMARDGSLVGPWQRKGIIYTRSRQIKNYLFAPASR